MSALDHRSMHRCHRPVGQVPVFSGFLAALGLTQAWMLLSLCLYCGLRFAGFEATFQTANGSWPCRVCWVCGSLVFFREIGFFTAAARAAAVVLSLAYPAGNRTSVSTGDDVQSPADESSPSWAHTKQPKWTHEDGRQASSVKGRGGVASCFVEVTPENLPAVWRVYQPKFEDGKGQGCSSHSLQ